MTFWSIVGSIVVSFGGVAGIVALIIKFSGNMIAERLSKKYDQKLTKELESIKSNLERKNYISKTRFDAEFQIYRDLSKSFFDAIKAISTLVPCGFTKVPADEAERKKYDDNNYKTSINCVGDAQDILLQNAPFINKEFYDAYGEILALCRLQLNAFDKRYDVFYVASQSEKESFEREDYDRTREINEKFFKLNDLIREYLFSLDVIE